MGKIAEDLDAAFDDTMAFTALDVGEKADTAVVVFVGRIVKALCGRHANKVCHRWSLVVKRSDPDTQAPCY